jgi:hypothetical protein
VGERVNKLPTAGGIPRIAGPFEAAFSTVKPHAHVAETQRHQCSYGSDLQAAAMNNRGPDVDFSFGLSRHHLF